MSTQTIHLSGRPYVILEREEYERINTLAKASQIPAYPTPDAKGNIPALEAIRVSIARDIIKDRAKAGLNQRELAELAGIRVETLCRIETGKFTPRVSTIDRIDRALKKALSRKTKGG